MTLSKQEDTGSRSHSLEILLLKRQCTCCKADYVMVVMMMMMMIHTHVYRMFVCTFTYTVYTQENGAVSKVNKKFISHLTRAKRTPSAAATVQVSHALNRGI